MTKFHLIDLLADMYMRLKGTVKLYFFLLKKMPLVCTKNVTFLFFQSSTYNMLKIATFVYFAVIFSWARHCLHGLGHRKFHLFFPVSEYIGPSPTSRARRRFHGPVTALSKAKAHIYGDGPTKK